MSKPSKFQLEASLFLHRFGTHSKFVFFTNQAKTKAVKFAWIAAKNSFVTKNMKQGRQNSEKNNKQNYSTQTLVFNFKSINLYKLQYILWMHGLFAI